MVDSLTLYNAQFHKVKLTETNGAVHIETADLYESEYDSGYDEAIIGLTNGYYYKEHEGTHEKDDEQKSIQQGRKTSGNGHTGDRKSHTERRELP